MVSNETIDQMNSFLRGELAAVETYRLALERIKDPSIAADLRECQISHMQRVESLSNQIRALGGEPAKDSGAWGAFAKLVEGGAAAFGEKAAVAALEEGEDHGIKDYRGDATKLETQARAFVEQQLLPAQQYTHRTMSALQQRLDQRFEQRPLI